MKGPHRSRQEPPVAVPSYSELAVAVGLHLCFPRQCEPHPPSLAMMACPDPLMQDDLPIPIHALHHQSQPVHCAPQTQWSPRIRHSVYVSPCAAHSVSMAPAPPTMMVAWMAHCFLRPLIHQLTKRRSIPKHPRPLPPTARVPTASTAAAPWPLQPVLLPYLPS